MSGYTKLFQSLLDSTIWQESNETRLLWITMLAMADKSGEVQASIPGLAKRAGISLADAESGLQTLLSPDPYSRTPDNEGRRIAPVDGGWILLNHAKYRELMSYEERKEYNRRKQAEFRARKSGKSVNDTSITVNHNKQCQHSTKAKVKAKADTEAKADRKQKHECKSGQAAQASKARPQTREDFDSYFREIGLYPRDAEATWNKWEGNGWANGGKKIVCWKSTVRAWKASGYMPSQKNPSDYEQGWPSEKLETIREDESDDLMASFLRHKEAEIREAAGDHPDYWTEEEKEQQEEAECF
jgi:hypothetical protein